MTEWTPMDIVVGIVFIGVLVVPIVAGAVVWFIDWRIEWASKNSLGIITKTHLSGL